MTTTSSPLLPPVLLVGAGKMGMALFEGWTSAGLAPSVIVKPSPVDPPAPHRYRARLDDLADFTPEIIVIAVKPQKGAEILPALAPIVQSSGALVVSMMAGIETDALERAIGGDAICVRIMPNTPAAIGRGVSLAWAPDRATPRQRELVTRLLTACGDVVWLDTEAQMNPATAISGCGPAYLFLLAECLEAAGVAQGLPQPVARMLARRTLSGSGALLDANAEDAAVLRRAVTSPNGVTERALSVLMHEDAWPSSIDGAIAAATARSAELAQHLGDRLHPAGTPKDDA